MATQSDSQLQMLVEKDAIRDVVLLYCHAMDRHNQELLAKAFWPESQLEYGMFKGTGAEFANSVFTWQIESGLTATLHSVSNSLIRITGDEAYGETYFNAYHRIKDASGKEHDNIVAGRYHDTFAKRANAWRILKRRIVFDWYRDYTDAGDWTTGFLGINHDTAPVGSHKEPSWATLRPLIGG